MNALRPVCLVTVIGMLTPVTALAEITVGVNQISVVHKSSNGVSIAFPDVCKTPSPSGPIPIPYPNIAKSSDTAKGSKRTKMVTEFEQLPEKAQKRKLASDKGGQDISVVRYSLAVATGGRVHLQQSAGVDSVTTATYIDGKGNKFPIREHALIKLASGDLCAICAARDGKVTAVYRLFPEKQKRRAPKRIQ